MILARIVEMNDLYIEYFILFLLLGLFVVFLMFITPKFFVFLFLGIFLFVQQLLVFWGIPYVEYIDEIFVLLLLIIIVARRLLSTKPSIPRTPIDIYFLGFVILGVISSITNQVPLEVAARGLYSTIKGILIFFIVFYLAFSIDELRRFIKYLIGVGVVVSLVSIGEIIFGLDTFRKYGLTIYTYHKWGMPSFFNHPAHAAYFLGFVMSFLIARIVINMGSKHKNTILLLFLMIGFVLSNSRAAWLALGVSLFLTLPNIKYISPIKLSINIRYAKITAQLLLLLIVFLLIFYFGFPEVEQQINLKIQLFSRAVDYYILQIYPSYQGVDLRMIALFEGLKVLMDHLFLGVGPGRYGGWVAYEFPSPVYTNYNIPYLGTTLLRQSDNFWIHLLVESGIIAMGIFLLLLRTIYKGYKRATEISLSKDLNWIGLGAKISFIFIIVGGLFSPILEGPPIPFLFWGLAGAVLSQLRSY